MRFYYKIVPDNIDDYMKLKSEIIYLSEIGVIPIKWTKK